MNTNSTRSSVESWGALGNAIPPKIGTASGPEEIVAPGRPQTRKEALEGRLRGQYRPLRAVSRAYCLEVLEAARFNKTLAARVLGITPASLNTRLGQGE